MMLLLLLLVPSKDYGFELKPAAFLNMSIQRDISSK